MTDLQSIWIIGGLTLFVLASFATIIFFFTREFRLRSSGPGHMQTDLTNMMILFQTMRDILDQQKDLAREFNISIDKKVSEVRSLIQSTSDVRAKLDQAQREIAELSRRTRRDLIELQARLADVGQRVPEEESPKPAEAPSPSGKDLLADERPIQETPSTFRIGAPDPVEPAAAVEENVVEEATAAEGPSAAVDRPSSGKRDLIDAWTGLDFGAREEVEAEPPEAEPSEIESKEDEAQTREAFRSLLNLDSAASSPDDDSPVDILSTVGNGGQHMTPIQKRVYEYSDAGMRVPEIAREMGVGKGEIRLILSLRQDREAS